MASKITLQPSGKQIILRPGQTVLAAAMEQGINLPYGCRSGRCGTCKGELISGSVRYDQFPAAITESEHNDGQVVLCQARVDGNATVRIREINDVGEIKPKRMPCKVIKLQRLCHDVMRMDLKIPENIRLQFLAGQYLDIFQDNRDRRSFSIANAPHDDQSIELHIRHVEGGEFTRSIFEDLTLNTILRIEAPLGTFFLREQSKRPVILMGGGTGFAPLKGIIEHAFHIDHDVPMHLFWGVRAKRDLYLQALPERWQKAHRKFSFTPVLSEPTASDRWQGATGFVHEQVAATYGDLSGFDLYMSGPPVMIEAARDCFLEHGLPRERMFSDAFEFNSQQGNAA